jgi:hypothetical protein
MGVRQFLILPSPQLAVLIATAIAVGSLGTYNRSAAQEWLPVDEIGGNSSQVVEQVQQPEWSETVSEEAAVGEWEPAVQPDCNCPTECKGKCPGVNLDPGHPAKPKHKKPGDINQGDCPSVRYRMDDCIRSGDPSCVYQWAVPSITDKYSAWYVGGGAAFKGRGRTAAEGTWGLDYDGLFGHARTWLNYTCNKRQGGEGAYQTDHVPLKKKISEAY